MNKPYAIKSWIFAIGVTAILLLAVTQKASANHHQQSSYDNRAFAAGNMQLARGDSAPVVNQRRTYLLADDNTQADNTSIKATSKDKKGVQGPAGKTPTENGPQGNSQHRESDALRIPGDVADGCSKFLRCSGD